MIKKILVAVVAVLLVLSVFIATRPAHFRVQRSAQIHAPSPVVFSLIDDFTSGPSGRPGKSSIRG